MTAVVEDMTLTAAALGTAIEDKEKEAAKKQKQLDGLNAKTAVAKKEAAEVEDIDAMAKKTIGGNYQLTPANWEKVSNLAKEGVKSRGIIAGLKKQITDFIKKNTGLETELKQYKGGASDNMRYFQALQRAPRRLFDTVADILRRPPERQEPERTAPERKQSHVR